MPNIGPMELLVVLIVALLILGPKRLPDAGRSLGRGITEFRAGISGKGGESAALVERPAPVAAPPASVPAPHASAAAQPAPVPAPPVPPAAGGAEQARASEERPGESSTSP